MWILAAALVNLPLLVAFRCWQCGGELVSNSVRLSRDFCCRETPVICERNQVCVRALVSSIKGRFFLSGCHAPEDGLIGCDSHSLSHNASVHRCVCVDERCQHYFPGSCQTSTRAPSSTTRRRPTTPWPATVARLDTKRPEVQEGLTSSSMQLFSFSSVVLLSLCFRVL